MKIEVSIGEILDKLSILTIKHNKIKQINKLLNINIELEQLQKISQNLLADVQIKQLYSELLYINEKLWNIEDLIRIKEKNKQFDQDFIDLARGVYTNNDIRASIKKQINTLSKSPLCEEKSYEKY